MLGDRLKQKAQEFGFDAFGIVKAEGIDFSKPLKEWLDAGYYGDMAWMSDRYELRKSPSSLWADVKSIIVLGVNYAPGFNPLEKLNNTGSPNISVYAGNLDYHDVIKKQLKALASWFAQETGAQVKVFVDTAPVMEKPLAQKGGIGWQGKHTNVVSRQWGSWLFLAEIFTDYELPETQAEVNHCGKCTKCLDVCPTQAFVQPYLLDARKCISYLTIEHKSQIPLHFRQAMGNRIYGCDDCLSICPWNKFAQNYTEEAFGVRESLQKLTLKDILILDDTHFRLLFSKSPIKRVGRDRFVRNALVAVGNSGQIDFLPFVSFLAFDSSPLVRGMAVWAYKRLASGQAWSLFCYEHSIWESDADVRHEYCGDLTNPAREIRIEKAI